MKWERPESTTCCQNPVQATNVRPKKVKSERMADTWKSSIDVVLHLGQESNFIFKMLLNTTLLMENVGGLRNGLNQAD